MKRLFTTLFLLSFIIISASCNKEPEINLVGTEWGYEYGSTGNHVSASYEFVSSTGGKVTFKGNVRIGPIVVTDGSSVIFSYALDYPHITIINEALGTEHFTFTDKKTMVRDGTDGSGNGNKLTKK